MNEDFTILVHRLNKIVKRFYRHPYLLGHNGDYTHGRVFRSDLGRHFAHSYSKVEDLLLKNTVTYFIRYSFYYKVQSSPESFVPR